ncbi:MAG: protein PhnA, partial [Myxococcota bacterium]
DQLYLDDDTAAWAQAETVGVAVVDSNGTVLADGDSVTLIKDLPVKGANFTAKRGTLVRGIRLGDDPSHVLGRVNKTSIYLKTEFLKKA